MEENDELTLVGKCFTKWNGAIQFKLCCHYWDFLIDKKFECVLNFWFRSAEAAVQREGCPPVHRFHQEKQKETRLEKCGPRYCQMVRETNRVARLAFGQQCLESNEKFEDVIFTDESTIWLERHGKICFGKDDRPAKLKPKRKHPFKVHVWAGISTGGATSILIFRGIMKKEFYVNEILGNVLLPYTQAAYPDGGYRFQQDNDPKHKSKFTWNIVQLATKRWP